jgi:hypothetical protein
VIHRVPKDALRAGLPVLLTVACGVALQLSLIRLAVILGHGGAAFPTLAAHIAGWGVGLGVLRATSTRVPDPALLAAGAALVAWLGTAGSMSTALTFGASLGMTRIVLIALVSGALIGGSIAAALAARPDPVVALAADLCGVGLGAASHVALAAVLPGVPAAIVWLSVLALVSARQSIFVALATSAVAASMLLPLDRPETLASADTPLGNALRERGLQAWKGSFHDLDGRVDAVSDGPGGGVALYINAGTQAQTPREAVEPATAGILALLKPRSALVLGAGGMVEVAALLRNGVERVAAVERSEAVLRAARSSSPAARRALEDDRVRVIKAEGRRFVSASSERFDLVLLPLAYASAGASPAALMLYPSYLFSVEGIRSLSEVTSTGGAVCFVLPSVDLRDRILSSVGRIEAERQQRRSLARRLWVAQSRRASAYSDIVCWAPHAALAGAGSIDGLKLLHRPDWDASRQLTRRLDGLATLAPTSDWRPYFFDLFTLHSARPRLPPFVITLLFWTLASAILTTVAFSRRRGGSGTPVSSLAIAWLTGFAFPALEYVVLAIARAAGFSEGASYAHASLTFGAAGLVAAVSWGSLRGRAILGCGSLAGIGLFLGGGGVSWLLALPSELSLACASGLMAATMIAGVATFAGLFRMQRSSAASGGVDVRPLFVASALGTLAAIGPVLAIELRWGGVGSALLASLVYLSAFAVAQSARRRTG